MTLDRWKHKRGSTYRVIGRATGQDETSADIEGQMFVVYQSESDGSIWVRRYKEFHDGRFERIDAGGNPAQISWLDEERTPASDQAGTPSSLPDDT